MAESAILAVEGVLRQPAGGGPIAEGQILYGLLTQVFRVVLLAHTDSQPAELEHWLTSYGMRDHQFIVRADTARIDAATRWGRPTVFVTPDPAEAHAGYDQGLTVLLFIAPAYARPEFRPDYDHTPLPWQNLVEALETTSHLRDNDRRCFGEGE